mgnify:CR=1 FL=1
MSPTGHPDATDPRASSRDGRAPVLAVLPREGRPPVDRDTHDLALAVERLSVSVDGLTTAHGELKDEFAQQLQAQAKVLKALEHRVGAIRKWPTMREVSAATMAILTVLAAIAQILHGQVPTVPPAIEGHERAAEHATGEP